MSPLFHSAIRAASRKLQDSRVRIALVFALVCGAGIMWGLPASDGWDNDGVAPRDFLPGLIDTYRPGSYFTYPPLHLWVLAILTSPITAMALAYSSGATTTELVHEFTRVEYMTAFAVVARVVSLAMAGGIVVTAGRIAEELWDARAGVWTSILTALNMSLVYYAHTSNLDVPYIFWALLAVRQLALSVLRGREGHMHLRRGVAFALAAVATKDQAYAAFVLLLPAAFLALALASVRTREGRRDTLVTAGWGIAMAVLVFGVLEAGLLNPAGFQARLRFLRGSASQDFVDYTDDWVGRATVVRDVVARAKYAYPAPWLLVLLAVGAVRTIRGAQTAGGDTTRRSLARSLPALGAVSFVAFFSCVARRTDHRFVLPVYVLLSVYAGVGAAWLWSLAGGGRRAVARVLVAGGAAWAAYWALAVCVTLAFDPRYEAEAWLRGHAKPGETIEVYGLNVYLPRLPAGVRAFRVGGELRRNPMPGLEEVTDAFRNVEDRKPTYIVVSSGWVWRYMQDPSEVQGAGRVMPPTQAVSARETDGTEYFRALLSEKLRYRVAVKAAFRSRVWPTVDIHASTGRDVLIFKRAEPTEASH